MQNEHLKFKVFSIIWCISTIFHQLTFTDWIRHSVLGWAVSIACLLYLFFPQRYLIFVFALFGHVVVVYNRLPFVANHMVFEFLLNVTITAAVIYYWIRSRTKEPLSGDTPASIWQRYTPVAQVSLIIMYFYVVFHKLNTDFFDPAVSCGGELFEGMVHNFYLTKIGFIGRLYEEHALFLRAFSVYFTILSEIMIPVLLATRRFRNLGILFGLFFHIVLPFHGHIGIYSFSALMYTLYVFFWDDVTFKRFYEFYEKHALKIRAYFVFVFVAVVGAYFSGKWFLFNGSSTLFWFAYSVVYSYVFFFVARKSLFTAGETNQQYKTSILWFAVVVIFMNGTTPYLGLKTEMSYAMFSNLRTEDGKTNHFFIPATTQIFNYQKELVTIIDTDNNTLKNIDRYEHGDVHVVYFEFVRLLNAEEGDFYVKARYNGKEYYIKKEKGQFSETELDLHQNFFIKKAFRFRPVYTGEQSFCQH
jgi:hypothetical protein